MYLPNRINGSSECATKKIEIKRKNLEFCFEKKYNSTKINKSILCEMFVPEEWRERETVLLMNIKSMKMPDMHIYMYAKNICMRRKNRRRE